MDLAAEARRRGRPLRILVTRLRYLGDVILTTPVISALKFAYPRAEIFYLAEEPYASVLEGHPDLSGVISLRPGAVDTVRTIMHLRRLRFVAALDLFYNPRSAQTLFAAGIPIRVGGSRRWRRRLYTDTFTVPRGIRSALLHHCYPLTIFGVPAAEALPRIYLGEEERADGGKVLAAVMGGEEAAPVVAIHPGGTWPSKRWPQPSFASLARDLHGRLGARVLVITGPGEERIARAVQEGAGACAAVLPLQSIRRLASVLVHCTALVANDGGVLHMAVALGMPTVGIFGPTEPDIWFPYEGKGPFVVVTRNEHCAPCHRHRCDDLHCLDEIAPEEVLGKLEEVLNWPG